MIKVECDCSCATACPQGRIGSQDRCWVWKYEPTELKAKAAAAAPTFEAGKSYRTRGLGVATVDMIAEHGTIHGAAGGHSHVIWAKSGLLSPPGHSEYDLLPGAIEDEKEAAEPWPDANVNDRLTALEAAVVDRERMSDLRQIHSRINRQAERLEDQTKHQVEIYRQLGDLRSHTGRNAMAERIEALEKAAEAMPGPYAMGQRLEALEEQMTAALGITLSARPRPATPVELAISTLDGRLDNLQTLENQLATRLDVVRDILEGQGWDLNPAPKATTEQCEIGLGSIPGCECHFCRQQLATKPTATVDSASWTGRPTPTKPTIKGGWVNVYLMPDGHGQERLVDWNRTIGVIWTSRAYATSYRKPDAIACIQIPDITEGEGL